MNRAQNLLRSAKDLYEQGDLAGVAGLAYAAFESATMALTNKVNGKDHQNHRLRMERIKSLLSEYEHQIDFLWEVRNIDFYGNVKIGSPKREISSREVQEGLDLVERIIKEIEEMLKDPGATIRKKQAMDLSSTEFIREDRNNR